MTAIIDKVIVVSLEQEGDVSEGLISSISGKNVEVALLKAESFKSLLTEPATTLAVFVIQTIENDEVPEKAGAAHRFFKRKTHPPDLIKDKFQFCVFGSGDSSLLLDRQTTAAKDCNACAKVLDARLEAVGGTRFYGLGMSDERTGMQEVEPWSQGLVEKLQNQTTTGPPPPPYAAGVIRLARAEDVAAIFGMIVELADYEKARHEVKATADDIAEMLFGGKDTPSGAPHCYCHVVEEGGEGGEIVGFAMWHLNISTWRGRYSIYLEDLYVKHANRGEGHGKALLQTLQDECATRGYPRLTWQCLDWNKPSIDFYRSIGASSMDEWMTFRIEKEM